MYMLKNIFSSNFADDKKKASIIRNINDAEHLQKSIDNFIRWCSDNGLSVNLSKCKIISFTMKSSPIIYQYKIGDQVIDRVNEIRDLGVILDKKLNFNNHIETITNKAKSAFQFVRRQSYFFDIDVVKILYTSLVRSNLEFACSIWLPQSADKITMVESVQKQMVIVLKGDHHDRSKNNYKLSPYVERCSSVDLNTLIRRRVNLSILFIHSILTGKFKCPSLRALMNLNTGLRTLREPEFIRIKTARTNTSTYSSFNNACHAFNHAALFIDPSLPQHEFRRKLLALPDESFGPWARLAN